jgi:hypothetical protein
MLKHQFLSEVKHHAPALFAEFSQNHAMTHFDRVRSCSLYLLAHNVTSGEFYTLVQKELQKVLSVTDFPFYNDQKTPVSEEINSMIRQPKIALENKIVEIILNSIKTNTDPESLKGRFNSKVVAAALMEFKNSSHIPVDISAIMSHFPSSKRIDCIESLSNIFAADYMIDIMVTCNQQAVFCHHRIKDEIDLGLLDELEIMNGHTNQETQRLVS